MRGIYLYILLFLASPAFAQNSVQLPITFQLKFEHKPLQIKDYNNDSLSDSILIENLQFYISKIELYHKNELVFEEPNSFHLIQASDASSLQWNLEIPDSLKFTQVKMQLGIDSLTNVSGAFGGDLDPTNGMYWAWQSGYINFKLEGRAMICPARHQRFQFHIGGYMPPFQSIQSIDLATNANQALNIDVNIDAIFEKYDVSKQYRMMSPNEKTTAFAQLLPQLFSIQK